MSFCIIDLGTNSVRLFIFERTRRGSFRELHHEKIMVRLGDKLFGPGQLDPEAVTRTIEAFKHFRRIIDEFKPELIEAVATSALREAADRDELIEAVRAATGIVIRVISGAEEASLIAEGILANVDVPPAPVVLIDLGGGSCEVTYCVDRKVQRSASLPLGAARGQQLYLKSIPPTTEGEQLLRTAVRALLEPVFPSAETLEAQLAIGSSGSIRALGELYQKHSSRHSFPHSYLSELLNTLRPLTRPEIVELGGVREKRSDLIVSALIILDEVCGRFGVKRIRPTNFALKDGVLQRLAAGGGE